MNDKQKSKRNFRQSKAWKEFKKKKYLECGKIDAITRKKLYKTWQLHHEDLNEENYQKLNNNFLCCNNLTHKVIHWLYNYYKTDEAIIDRLKAEMDRMKAINQGGDNEQTEQKTGREKI